jgi:hypothetical protein
MNLTGITPDEREMLQDLLERSGHKTQVDLVNEALTLYGYQLSIIEEGGSLPYQDHPSGIRKEIAIPSFLAVITRVKKLAEAAVRGKKKTGS